jgi:hypothetical protein
MQTQMLLMLNNLGLHPMPLLTAGMFTMCL